MTDGHKVLLQPFFGFSCTFFSLFISRIYTHFGLDDRDDADDEGDDGLDEKRRVQQHPRQEAQQLFQKGVYKWKITSHAIFSPWEKLKKVCEKFAFFLAVTA